MQASLEQKAIISLAGLETENLSWGLSPSHTDFWNLWKQYEDYFYGRCLKWMGGNSYDAEDLLSRAMLKAWNLWSHYPGTIVNPKAWFSRLIHNLSVDVHRERQRETQLTDQALVTPSVESPESGILRHELGIYLRHRIESLPPRLRDSFILRCYQQKSYRDIAKQLALSEDNVYKRIKKAQTILQKQLHKYLEGKDETDLDSLSPHLKSLIPSAEESQNQQKFDLLVNGVCGHKEEPQKPDASQREARRTLSTSSPIHRGGYPSPPTREWNFAPTDDETAISHWEAPVTMSSISEQINYKVAVICLETLPHHWYSSPSPLGWR